MYFLRQDETDQTKNGPDIFRKIRFSFPRHPFYLVFFFFFLNPKGYIFFFKKKPFLFRNAIIISGKKKKINCCVYKPRFEEVYDRRCQDCFFSDISERNNSILTPSTSEGGEWGRWSRFFVLEVPDYESAMFIYIYSHGQK